MLITPGGATREPDLSSFALWTPFEPAEVIDALLVRPLTLESRSVRGIVPPRWLVVEMRYFRRLLRAEKDDVDERKGRYFNVGSREP